jgi:hypothetical protein
MSLSGMVEIHRLQTKRKFVMPAKASRRYPGDESAGMTEWGESRFRVAKSCCKSPFRNKHKRVSSIGMANATRWNSNCGRGGEK